MPRPNVDNLVSLGDFATSINWNFIVVTSPSAVDLTTDSLNFRCESADVPKMSSSSTTITIRGIPVKQPGVWTPSGQITLNFYETIDNTINNYIKTWREACWLSKIGTSLPKSQVTGIIQLQRNDRQDNAIWQYTLYNAYLEDYDSTGGALQGQSADSLRPSMTLSYDYFIDGPYTGTSTSGSTLGQ
jgi:hypothetical protein